MTAKLLCLAAAGLLLAAADKPDDPNKKDLDNLQGTWKVESARQGGKDLSVEKLALRGLVVAGEKITLKDPNTSDHDATFTLDATKKPATIDFLDKDGKVMKSGVYAFDGDALKLAFIAPGSDRPTELASKSGSDVVVLTLKREKK